MLPCPMMDMPKAYNPSSISFPHWLSYLSFHNFPGSDGQKLDHP